jgi:succinate dehydrogenase / fumarate reductase cytochrome b subunit
MNRPLSPHLQIYRWQLTSILSILHRLTGIGLSIVIPLLIIWLGALSAGEDIFLMVFHYYTSPPGLVVLLLILWAFYYHLLNGIRHLAWDGGYGFSLPATYRSGWLVVALSFGLTALTWMIF